MQPGNKSYRDLLIWQKSQILFEMICNDIKLWPKNIVSTTIANQAVRSFGSISACIAEGYGRGGPKEFEHFLRMSRGSLSESSNWIDGAFKEKLLSEDRYTMYNEIIEELSKMIAVFIHRLRTQERRKTI